MLEKKNIFDALVKHKLMVKEEEIPEEAPETGTAPLPVLEPIPSPVVEQAAPQLNQAGLSQDSVIEKKLDTLIESYEKNKLLSIDDIYRKFGLETDVKRTVFMADIYMKALPENLPVDIKRESVHNIMNASDIKIDDLLNDAYKRIDSLNNVLEGVVATTEELRVKQIATIKDLEKRIEELKRTMMERDKFQDTQNTTIEYEIQRVINIVDFVKPKK